MCRFFRDRPDILIPIAWYPAAPGARHLPFDSAFMSRDWCKDFEELNGVGEVWGANRNYNGRLAIPGLLGEHQCGDPDWFKFGVPYDAARPPQVIGPNGIPECCGPPAPRPAALIVLGAHTSVFTPVHFPEQAIGGIALGGEVGDVYTPPLSAVGGIALGGEVGDEYTPPMLVNGGLAIGGEVTDVYTPPSGEWTEDEAGDYEFEVIYTGWHYIQGIGAGGGGSQSREFGMWIGGGGGGGGAWAGSTVYLTAGDTLDVHVGAGGVGNGADGEATTVGTGPPTLQANGGESAVFETHGSGATTSPYGDAQNVGGDGADGSAVANGGGGGSSASADGPGVASPGFDGGTAPPGGGDGGSAGEYGFAGFPGFVPGGAGGGSGSENLTDTSGADGMVSIVWPVDPP